MISQLRSKIVQLDEDSSNGAGDDQRKIDRLSQAVARVTESGFRWT